MLQIFLKQLNSGANKWLCSNISELIIGSFIAKHRGLEFSDLTLGNRPEYDYRLGEFKVEQKISSAFANTDDPDLKFGIVVEYARVSGTPSGIMLSKADKFVFLTPGYSNEINAKVGKLRMIDAGLLTHHVGQLIGNEKLDIRFQKQDPDGGARCVVISSKHVKHDWIADVSAIVDGDNVIGYDFEKVLRIIQ